MLRKWPKDIRAKQAPETTNNESNTPPQAPAPAPIPPLAFLHPQKLHTTPVSHQSSKMPGARINGVLWPRETTKTLLLQLILLLSSSSYSSNRTSSSSSCSSCSSSFSSSCHLPYTTAKCTIKRSQTAQMWRKHARGESAQETTKGERPRERRQERRGRRSGRRRRRRRREGANFGGRK